MQRSLSQPLEAGGTFATIVKEPTASILEQQDLRPLRQEKIKEEVFVLSVLDKHETGPLYDAWKINK